MEIRDQITITQAKRPSLDITIPETEGDDILTLRLKGRLTPAIAGILACGYLYDDKGNPHEGFKQTTLAISLVDMELQLIGGGGGAMDSFFPENIFDFCVYMVGESSLGVSFKVRTTGRLQEILDFFRANRGDGFTVNIKPPAG